MESVGQIFNMYVAQQYPYLARWVSCDSLLSPKM